MEETTEQTAEGEKLTVVLLGDSVLDDFYWLSDGKKDVRWQLEQLLLEKNADNKVLNWAVDESTIGEVLYGAIPRMVYVNGRQSIGMDPYPTENGKVYPLKLLASNPDVTHAVLSIGGNDARAAFAESFDLENIYLIMTERGIVKSFESLVSKIIHHVPKLMLVVVYHPQITMVPLVWGLPPANVVKELLIKFSPMFITVAKKFGLPLIDLSRTFDPHDGSDYGTTPIEPSVKSGQYIADLINHIIQDFKFGVDPAKVYWGTGNNIQSADLDSWDEGTYRKALEDHLSTCEKKQSESSVCVVS